MSEERDKRLEEYSYRVWEAVHTPGRVSKEIIFEAIRGQWERAERAEAERDRLREAGTALASWVGDVLQGWRAHAQIASGKGGGMGANILQESAARYGSRYHWLRVEKALNEWRALASGEESRHD